MTGGARARKLAYEKAAIAMAKAGVHHVGNQGSKSGAKGHGSQHRRHKKEDPCLALPLAPGAPTIDFINREHRHHPWWGRVTVADVTTDVDGLLLAVPVRKYRVQVKRKRIGAGADEPDIQQFYVWNRENDTNGNTTKLFHCHKGWQYSARARGETGLLLKADLSAWSPWSVYQNVTETLFPARNVTVSAPSPRRIMVKWDPPRNLNNIDHVGLDLYRVELYQGGTLKDTQRTRSEKCRFTVDEADKTKSFNAKVYAIDENAEESAAASSGNVNETGNFTAVPTGDSKLPGTSPAANAAGMARYISVWWTPIANPDPGTGNVDPVQYEVHLGTTTGFAVSSATLVGMTPGNSGTITRLPNGNPLALSTNYFVRIRAVDLYDGPGPAGLTSSPAVQVTAQVSDGAPVSATPPTPNLTVSGGFIKASWTPVSNADPVSYEVHVSGSSFTPVAGAASTLFTVVDGLNTIITRLPPMTSGGTPLVPGSTYWVALVPRDFDGPTTPIASTASIMVPGQTSDGSLPATPPIDQVVAGIGYIQPVWTPLTYGGPANATQNPDPVVYEVYCSSGTLASPPVAADKVGETTGSNFYIRRLGSGAGNALLTYDRTYNVKIRARDPDGQATAASANKTGVPLKADYGDLKADAVHADTIKAGEVTADHLQSNLVLGGKVIAANVPQTIPPTPYDTVNRIEMDGATGMRVILDDGTTETYPVTLPLDGTQAKFRGGIDADSIDASGPVNLASNGNALLPGSILAMNGVVVPPTSPPGVSGSWPVVQLGTKNAGTHHGLTYSATGGAGGATACFYSTLFNEVTVRWEVVEYLASNGNVNRTFDASTNLAGSDPTFQLLGVAVSTNYIHFLWSSFGSFFVDRLAKATLAMLGTTAMPAVNNKRPGIQWDGTNMILVTTATAGATARIRLRKFAEDWTGGANLDLDAAVTVDASKTKTSGGVLALNSGQTYQYIAVDDNSGNPRNVIVFNPTTGAEIANGRFGDGSGIGPDDVTVDTSSQTIYTLPANSAGEYHRHSDVFAFSANTNKVWVGYTWRDSVGTAPNQHETLMSPRLAFTWPRRAQAAVTWPTPPTNLGGADDVDTVRIYALQNATDPGTNPVTPYFRQANITVFPTPQTSTLLTTLNVSAVTASVVAFPNVANPGKIVSASGRFSIAGNDAFLMPKLCVQASRAGDQLLTPGTYAQWTIATQDYEYLEGILTTGAMLDIPNNRFLVPTGFAGLWQMTCQITFTAGANVSGRTETQLRKNSAGAVGGGTQLRLVSQPGSDAKASQTLIWRGALVAGDYVEMFACSFVTDRDISGSTNTPTGNFGLWEYVGN